MGRLCGLEQDLILNREKCMRLCVGSIKELVESCVVDIGFFWSGLCLCVYPCRAPKYFDFAAGDLRDLPKFVTQP